MAEPLCIVIDIDGTLIGDISLPVCEWELVSSLEAKKMRHFKAFLIQHLKSGMLRHGIADFIYALRGANPNTEFFIYTASEEKWAHFLVPCIEQAIGFKFARPIFTRRDCVNKRDSDIYKSLACISTRAYKSLKSKYPTLKNAKQLVKNMVMIDNNHILKDKEVARCIVCPTYNYTEPYDVLHLLDPELISRRPQQVASTLQKYDLITHPTSDYHSMMSAYYATLSKVYKSHKPLAGKDSFWHIMGQEFVTGLRRKMPLESIVKHIKKRC